MGTKISIDIKECCRLAGIPFCQSYAYEKDEDDEASPFLYIHRQGDSFYIDTNFHDGWHDDTAPLADLFARLRDDMEKLFRATRTWSEMKQKAGECDFSCDQSEATFNCNEYVVKMVKRWNRSRRQMIVTASVENTKTNVKTEHELSDELTAESASTAIRLHIANINAN